MQYPIPTNNKPKKTLGYRIGQLFAVILIGCLTAIMICLAVRLCSWILPF